MNDEPQHEHLKEQQTDTIELFSALPHIFTLENIGEMICGELPFHPTLEEMKANISPEGKALKLRVFKMTIEFTGEELEPNGN